MALPDVTRLVQSTHFRKLFVYAAEQGRKAFLHPGPYPFNQLSPAERKKQSERRAEADAPSHSTAKTLALSLLQKVGVIGRDNVALGNDVFGELTKMRKQFDGRLMATRLADVIRSRTRKRHKKIKKL